MPDQTLNHQLDPNLEDTVWSKRNPILFLTGIFFINMISRLGIAPLLPGIEKDLAINHIQSTGFFFLISTGYCISLFSSIFLTPRFSHRSLIVSSSLLVGLSLILAASSRGLIMLQISMLALGLAGGVYLPSGIATLTASVKKNHWGKVLGFHQLAPNLAYIAAPLAVELMTFHHPWRTVLLVYGLASLVLSISYFQWGKGILERTDPPGLKPIKAMMLNPAILTVTFLFILGMGLNQGIFAVLPLYLTVERGFEPGWSNFLLALSRVIAFSVPLASGWFADRYSVKKVILIMLTCCMAGTWLLALLPDTWLWLGLILQAGSGVCIFPLCFTALSMVTTPKNRAVAVSVVVPTAHFLGSGLVPFGVGFLADAGYFNYGILGLGLITLLSLPLVLSIKKDYNDTQKEPIATTE